MLDIMVQLGLIFFASVVFMFLALRFSLPPVVGLLLAGAIIGPNALALITQTEYINLFGEIGAMLLLFAVGIEFSISKVAKMGLRPFAIWLVKDAFVFVVSYELSLFLGLGEVPSIVLASALTFSSTTFFLKFIQERGNSSNSPEANTIFIVLIIEDIVAVSLLAIYSSMANGHVVSYSSMLVSMLKALLIIAITYLVLQRVIKDVFKRLVRFKSDEIMLFLSLSFAIMMSSFSSFIGLAPSIGAFLAGNILSSVDGFKKTENTLSKFSMLFSAFFFLSIGMLVDVKALVSEIWIIAILFCVVLIGTFASVFSASYLLGARGKSAVLSGLLVLAIGEFSLLIAKQTASIVAPFDIVSVVSVLVFFTALSGGILIKYDKAIDDIITGLVPSKTRESAKNISLYFNGVLREFEPNGSVFNTFLVEARSSVISLVLLALISISGSLSYLLVSATMPQYTGYVLFGVLVIVLIPLVQIIFSAKKLMDSLAQSFHKSIGENLALDDVAMRDAAVAAILFATAFIIPLLVTVLKLPEVFRIAFIIPLILSALFVWNLGTTIRKMIFRREMHGYMKKRMDFKPNYLGIIGTMQSINHPPKAEYRGRKR